MITEALRKAKIKYRQSEHGRRHEYEYNRARRLADPEKFNRKTREWLRNRKIKCIELMGGKCKDCGNSFHPAVFDFHHLDPTEKEHKTSGSLMGCSWNFVLEELKKCVLLCANCHRIRHFAETIV